MDTLTHALSGMLVARASYNKGEELPLWLRSWAGFLVAAFPDIDFFSRYFGITAFLNFHRGITHSVVMIPVWALLLSWILSMLSRGKYNWKLFLPLSLLSLSIHIFADVITAYGTEVFSPISNYRVSIPTTFIIDLYFTGIILLAILISSFIRQHVRGIALAGVFCLLAYVLLQNYWRINAIDEAYASVPADRMANAQVSALPQPLSPFNWKIIIDTGDEYYIRYINLYRNQTPQATKDDGLFRRINALYTPLEQKDWHVISKFGKGDMQPWAKTIWQDEQMHTVRRFMAYPAIHRVDQLPDMVCIWFADQRFVLHDIRAPFIFGACQQRGTGKKKFLRLSGEQIFDLD